MRKLLTFVLAISAFLCAFGPGTAYGQSISLISTNPAQNEINVSASTSIIVDFSSGVFAPSVGDTTFIVTGNMTGRHFGSYWFSDGDARVTFVPDNGFFPGEIVSVTIKNSINAPGPIPIPLDQSYVFMFTIEASSGLGHIYGPYNFVLDDISIPYGLAVGDYNLDDDIDIAACGWNNHLMILDNSGSGVFPSSSTQTTIGTLPHAMVAADFNRDGFIDLASANQWNDSVAVMINDFGAAFLLMDQKPAGNNPNDIAAGDFDGDGHYDFAVTNRNDGTVKIYYNNGFGQFTTILFYTVGGEPYGIYAADFNNDYNMDLVVASRGTNSITELMGVGNGAFTLVGPTPVGNGATGVVSAILDNNAYPDHAIANYTDGTLTVLYRNSSGITGSNTFATQRTPRYIEPVDIDGDGDLDLAISNYDSSRVAIHYNDGAGDFSAYCEFPVDEHPYRVKSADVDGDGDMEIITVNLDGQDVTVFSHIPLIVVSYGDVNIMVSDPMGRNFGKNEIGVPATEIPDGYYDENLERDSLFIPYPMEGPYDILFVDDNSKTGPYAATIKIAGLERTVVVAGDPTSDKATLYNYDYIVEEGYHYKNGDANRDDQVNVGDAVFLISYVFTGGEAPYPELAGDANCDHQTNVGDAVYVISYVFSGGNKPCCCTLCGDVCD
jgi:hypothetical protein